MAIRATFITLGCKLNQLETESVADAFSRSGAVVSAPGAAEGCDLFIVNTCTVTGKAEQKARRAIRSSLASEPGSVALITGCYAQVDPGALASLHERALVLPGDEKAALLDLAAWLPERWQGHGDLLDALREWLAERSGEKTSPFAYNPASFAFHTRPALKIQDGCDNRCTYCRVCLARGASVSLPALDALERVRALEAAGRAEVVLTGVNISQYRDGSSRFPSLLSMLIEGTKSIAFRISSWEPDKVDAPFLEVFSNPRVRPHVHLPLQSGSDAVLGRMGRSYRRQTVLDAVLALRRAKQDPFIAADMIVGFPGESEEEFQESVELCERCDFAWIHAFPFSARPGTRALAMKPTIPERVAGERARILGAMARTARDSYIARQEGRLVSLTIEDTDGLHAYGTSDNYLKLRIVAHEAGAPLGLSRGETALCRVGRPIEFADAEARLEKSPK